MKRKWLLMICLMLLGCGIGASASADWNTCVAICRTEFVNCVRNHGGATSCSITQSRCQMGCMVLTPDP